MQVRTLCLPREILAKKKEFKLASGQTTVKQANKPNKLSHQEILASRQHVK